MRKLSNLQELTYRVTKSLKNNVAYRMYSKLESIVYNGEFLTTNEFMKSYEGELYKDPKSILTYVMFAGISINKEYLELLDIENEDVFWNMPYEKLTFTQGNTFVNPIDTINIDIIADSIIYRDWVGTAQSLRGNYGKHDIAFKKMIKMWEGVL